MSDRKKLFVSVFIFFHLLVIGLTTVPSGRDFLKTKFPIGDIYQRFFGLKQTWNMFAINTPSKDLKTQIMLTFSDGSVEEWSFEKDQSISPIKKFIVKQRLRKYAVTIATKKRKKLCSHLARFVYREVEKNGHPNHSPLIQVAIYHHLALIEDPAVDFVPHGQEIPGKYSAQWCSFVVAERGTEK